MIGRTVCAACGVAAFEAGYGCHVCDYLVADIADHKARRDAQKQRYYFKNYGSTGRTTKFIATSADSPLAAADFADAERRFMVLRENVKGFWMDKLPDFPATAPSTQFGKHESPEADLLHELCDVVSCHVTEGNHYLSDKTRAELIADAKERVGQKTVTKNPEHEDAALVHKLTVGLLGRNIPMESPKLAALIVDILRGRAQRHTKPAVRKCVHGKAMYVDCDKCAESYGNARPTSI